MNDFDTFARLQEARHSCRAFRPDPVPEADVTRMVTAAQGVASWCNSQAWQLIVTRPETTERLRTRLWEAAAGGMHAPDVPFPVQYEGAYQARRRECGMQLYDAVGIAREDRTARGAQMLENFRFFGAPHVALVTSPAALGGWGMLDCGGFIAAFMTAATSLGIASIAQAAVSTVAPALREELDIPDERLILCGISFGYADERASINQFRTSRASPEEVIDWQ